MPLAHIGILACFVVYAILTRPFQVDTCEVNDGVTSCTRTILEPTTDISLPNILVLLVGFSIVLSAAALSPSHRITSSVLALSFWGVVASILTFKVSPTFFPFYLYSAVGGALGLVASYLLWRTNNDAKAHDTSL